jgi:hypothetical protein
VNGARTWLLGLSGKASDRIGSTRATETVLLQLYIGVATRKIVRISATYRVAARGDSIAEDATVDFSGYGRKVKASLPRQCNGKPPAPALLAFTLARHTGLVMDPRPILKQARR